MNSYTAAQLAELHRQELTSRDTAVIAGTGMIIGRRLNQLIGLFPGAGFGVTTRPRSRISTQSTHCAQTAYICPGSAYPERFSRIPSSGGV
jgi:hypothetical protein